MADEKSHFEEFIGTMHRGELAEELSERMQELIEAVTVNDGKGSLTLVISAAPASDEMGKVKVTADVKLKVPVPGRKSTIWFVNENFTLSRSDPAQLRLYVSPGDLIAGEVDPAAEPAAEPPSDE